jgi:quinol monooxygenase YgiN
MPNATLRLVAHITSKPDTVEETKNVLRGLIEPTRAEEGCITYELLQSTEDPTRFTFVEEWTGDEALDAHFSTPHIQHVLSRADEIFAEPLDLRKYRLIG